MHAYLIIGANPQVEVDKLLKALKAKRIDFVLEKIADTREIIKFTSLHFSDPTAIVISNFEMASEEAQNAFLKSLEEPQKNLIYIISAKSDQNILPTIISRSKVIEMTSSRPKVSTDDIKKAQEFLSLNTKKKLLVTSKIKDREQAINFLNNLIFGGRENKENLLALDEALKAIRALKANGNVQLQLTNFVINSEN